MVDLLKRLVRAISPHSDNLSKDRMTLDRDDHDVLAIVSTDGKHLSSRSVYDARVTSTALSVVFKWGNGLDFPDQ